MTANHPYAAWLRRLAGLVALAGVLVLSACGGGSGAPNNQFAPLPPVVPPLTVLPAGPTIYSQVAATLTLSGGVAPYRAFSSNSAVLPVPQSLPGNTITLLAGTVNSATLATVTIQDSAGTSIAASVTILPGPASPPPELVVLPSPVDVYSTIATQLTISGGVPPYRAFSSNTAVLPVVQNVVGSIVNLLATTVTSITGVTVTIQDSVAQSFKVSVTVNPRTETPAPELVVLPESVVTSKGVPVTLRISGGLPEFRAYSSNPQVVPVTQDTFAARSIVIVANAVAEKTDVVVTIQDSAGKTDKVTVTVQPEPSTPPPPLAVLPSSTTIFSGVATSVFVSGGVERFTAFSSNPTVLPVTQAVAGSAIPLLATNVSSDTAVTLTVRDSVGQTATAAITVRAATLFSSVVIKPNLPDCGATAICSGQTGTATVSLQLPGGGAAPGRQVRFDVVAGPYAIAATGSGTSAQSVTVVSDAVGNAQVIIRANVDAPTQPAQIRATDITSGQQLTGDFLIQQRTDGSTILTVVPPEATILGAFTDECSQGFRVDYFIYGGTPPYRITQAFPTASLLIGTSGVPGTSAIVNAAGGFFEAVTNGTCVNPQTFSIVDATGRQTTAQLFNLVGTTAPTPPTPPTPPPDLSVVPASLSIDCSISNTVDFIITGGTPSYNASASPKIGASPTITASDNPSADPPVFGPTPVVRRSGGAFRVTNIAQDVTVSFVDSSNPQKQQQRTISCTNKGLSVLPSFVNYNTGSNKTCVGKNTTFVILNGTPPYAVTFLAPLPGNGTITPPSVATAGGQFVVSDLLNQSGGGAAQTIIKIEDDSDPKVTVFAEIDCP